MLLASIVVPILLAAGCSSSLPATQLPVNSASLAQSVTGSWDLVQHKTDSDGDALVDRHEIQLMAQGPRVLAVWHRSRTWSASDGRHFRCSESNEGTIRSRALYGGNVSGKLTTVHLLQQLEADHPSPCEGELDEIASCDIALDKGALVARCDGERTYTFSPRIDPPVPAALAFANPKHFTGVWTWHHRSIDKDGDIKTEDETWHLVQHAGQVEGFYDRVVSIRSSDGRKFRCNDEVGYSNAARFRVQGKLVEGKLHLRELSYKTLPGRCETGKRTLDSYFGKVASGGHQVHLSWHNGVQVLRRRY